MNLKNIKKITIPEGDVKKITIAGVVVWEEAVPKVLTSITLSGQTTSLNRGASFSFGGTVTAHYSDGSTANVTSSTTFTGYNMATAGTYTVTAHYTEDGVTKTATYSLTVNKAWSAVWSGSKTCKIAKGTISGSGNVCYTASGHGYNTQLRLTFTMSLSGGSGTNYYRKYGQTSDTTTKPSSPVSFTINATTSDTIVLRARRASSGTGAYVNVNVKRDGSNNRNVVNMNAGAASGASDYTVSITLTKVEQYY